MMDMIIIISGILCFFIIIFACYCVVMYVRLNNGRQSVNEEILKIKENADKLKELAKDIKLLWLIRESYVILNTIKYSELYPSIPKDLKERMKTYINNVIQLNEEMENETKE